MNSPFSRVGQPSRYFRALHVAGLSLSYPRLNLAEIDEVYRRLTALIWEADWDSDRVAVRSYYSVTKSEVPIATFVEAINFVESRFRREREDVSRRRLGGTDIRDDANFYASPRLEDRRYLHSLSSEIAKIEPLATRSTAFDRETETARQRTILPDDFRRRTKSGLDVLQEMTRILPPPPG